MDAKGKKSKRFIELAAQPQRHAAWSGLLCACRFFLGAEERRYWAWTIVLAIVYLNGLVAPYVLGRIVDFFTVYKNGDPLGPFYALLLLLGGTYIAASIIRLSAKFRVAGIAIRASSRARLLGFQSLLDQQFSWQQKEASGNKVQRILGGADALSELSSVFYRSVLVTLSHVIGVLGVFLYLDHRLLFACALYLCVFLAVNYYFRDRIIEAHLQSREAIEGATGALVEGSGAVQTVQALGIGAGVHKHLNLREQESLQRRIRIQRLGTLKWQAFNVLDAFSMAAVLWLIGMRVVSGQVSVGLITMYFSYFLTFSRSMGDFSDTYDKLLESRATIARMIPLFSSSVVDEGGLPWKDEWSELRLTAVDFSYPGQSAAALSGLQLKVKRAESYAIVGASGSGKSTILRLLLGMLEPGRGKVLLDEIPLTQISRQARSEHVSVVPQEIELFDMSLRDNLTLMADVDAAVLERALQSSCLERVIAALPQGLDTLLGENGARLSGGERQRLAVARALCRNPQILLLDEATSALDAETEERVLKGIIAQFPHLTLVAVTHRPAARRMCKHVIQIEGGKIMAAERALS